MSHRFFRYYTFVGHYLLLYGRTNNVVKRRAALCFAACQSKKVLPAWFASVDADIRIGRRRHPHRSTQTSVSVDADIRIGRCRHPHRSVRIVFTLLRTLKVSARYALPSGHPNAQVCHNVSICRPPCVPSPHQAALGLHLQAH